jgi:hypothetical protein
MFELVSVEKRNNMYYVTFRISEVQTTTIQYTQDAYVRMVNLMKQALIQQ